VLFGDRFGPQTQVQPLLVTSDWSSGQLEGGPRPGKWCNDDHHTDLVVTS
jgi:hypothetical protein